MIWDPFDEKFIQDPFPTYRLLREEHPVYFNEERNFFAISRFDDVVEANRDWATYSSAQGVDLDNTGSIFFGEGNVVETDPPEHDLFRAVLKDHLTPTFVRVQEPDLIARVGAILEDLRGRTQVDLAETLCTRLPLEVVTGLLGIAPSDRAWVYRRFHRHVLP